MDDYKQILAFGDSLTWGSRPEGGGRHPRQVRWPHVVEALLPGVTMFPEGLGGRTTCFDDPAGPADRNGTHILPTLLGTHDPLDLVVIMLGTNDLKPQFGGTADGAAKGMELLIEQVRSYPYKHGAPVPRILVVSPPAVSVSLAPDGLPAAGRSIAESLRFAPLFRALSERQGCAFFDAAPVISASPIDGVHLDAENTARLGRALAPVIAGLLGIDSVL